MAEISKTDARRLLSASNDGKVAAALRDVLVSQRRGSWLTINEAAALAKMSVRSFQRKLAANGVVFTELVDEARAELAVEMLKAKGGTVNEIATALGYSTPSNFARAFQRWTGKTPTEFRGGV